MKKGLICSCIFSFLFFSVVAQQSKTKVLLLGCFHFDNPGLDVAKFDNANILSNKRQQELKDILGKLEQFAPDKIFVEMPVAQQGYLDSTLLKYKSGLLTLNAGEIHQIAFRLAKELSIPTLFAVDYRSSDFPFDSLVNSAKEAGQYNLLGYIKTSIDSIQNDFNESLKKNTLRELLLNQNSKTVNEFQVGAYFDFLVAGKKGNHVGSYLASEWWRRNMIIYENILKQLDGKEKSILVIFGSGHTALFHEMMKYNKNFDLIPVSAIL